MRRLRNKLEPFQNTVMRFSLSKTPLFRSKKWLIMHTVNRDHEPPFWTCLQLNPNSDRKIRQHGRKKRYMKSLDPYLSFHLSNWITKLVHTEKTSKENLFIPRATIPSKSTCKKLHAPDWLITSTIMQFGACPTSSGTELNASQMPGDCPGGGDGRFWN